MALFSTRDIYLILRARDEASRVVRGFSNELLRSATAAQAAQARSYAAQLRQRAITLRASGATRAQVQGVVSAAQAWDRHAATLELNEKRTRALVTGIQQVGVALTTIGIGIAYAGAAATKFFIDSFKFSQEYQRQVALTKTQVDGFQASLRDLSETGLAVANNIAVPFEQIQTELYDIFSSTSANLKQGKILLEAFAKAAVAGQTPIQNAGRGTISIMNAFRIPLEDVNKVLDIQFQLVRKGVGTYEEFATVFGRIVPSAVRAGQNFQTMSGILAFMTRNGLSAAMAATSGARALDAMSNSATVSRLEKMGVKVRDLKGNFLPLVDILSALRDKLNKIPGDVAKAAALKELFKGSGGTQQARRFLDLILLKPGQLEEFKGFLDDMANASGQFENAYGQMADTAAAKSQLLSNRWKVLKERVGEFVTPWVLKLVTGLGNILDKFNKLDPKVQKAIVLFTAVSAVVAVIGGLFLAVGGILAGVVTAFVVAGAEILIVGGILAGLGVTILSVIGFFVALWKTSATFRSAVVDLWRSIIALKDQALEALKPVLADIEKRFLPKLAEAWRVLKDIAVQAIDLISEAINEYLIPALHAAEEWWKKNEATIRPLLDILGQVVKWVLIVAGIIIAILVGTAFISLITAVMSIIASFIFFVEIVKLVIKYVKFLIDYYKALWEILKIVGHAIAVAWNAVVDFFKNIGSAISSFFSNAKTWLFDAGKNIVQGLIDGVKHMFGKLADVARGIGQTIRDYLPFSPAKKGPLSGPGDPFKSGEKISRMIAGGMLSEADLIAKAANKLASQFVYDPDSASNDRNFGGRGRFTPSAPPTPPTGGPTYNNTFYISGTGTDPVTLSAQIAWELQARR